MVQHIIDTQQTKEKVMLVGVQTQEISAIKFETLMEELRALTDTAGGEVLTTLTQKLTSPDARTMVGKGKLEEIHQLIKTMAIDTVIFMNPLRPIVNRNLENQLEVKVIDRSQLILDIFAMRAQSREGKLQVELAQYEYLLPRTIGQGTSLSRLGAGIGSRGPGETKLETDRRHIRSRMTKIKRELADVVAHRDRTRVRRRQGKEFNIGLVGYTNAGKSTILNQLTQSEAYVQDQLFATLDPLTRLFEINGHKIFTITDTVGFIEDLPTELVHGFKSTLEEIQGVDILLHVVDASHPARNLHEQTVVSLVKDLEMFATPRLTVYNKTDLIEGQFEPTLFPNIQVSAYNKEDITRLKQAIWQECMALCEPFAMEVTPEKSYLLHQLQKDYIVETQDYNSVDNTYLVKGYRPKI